MATLIYIFTITISILVHDSFQQNTTIPAKGTDCKGNDFLCVDQKQFLICVQSDDRFETADQSTQTCGTSSYCDNNLNYECASSVPVTVTPNMVNTTMSPQTTDNTTESTTTVALEGTAQLNTTANSGVTDEILAPTTEGIGNTTESGPRPSITEAVTSNHVNDTTKLVESTTNVSTQSTITIIATTEDRPDVTTDQVTQRTPKETTVPAENITTITSQPTSTTVTSGVTDGEILFSTTVRNETPSANTEGVTSATTQPQTTSAQTSDTTKDGSIKPNTWAFGTTTTPAPTTSAPRFVCPSIGIYPHLTDSRKFVLCLKFGRDYHSISMPCPFKRVYDPETKRCSYKKPKISENTTTFRCFSEGYFNDPYSHVKYYICTTLGNGNFKQSEFKCPPHLVFSNLRKRCIFNRNDSEEDGDRRKKNFWDSRSSNENSSNSRENSSNESRS